MRSLCNVRYGAISTIKSLPLMNANLPNEGMSVVDKHKITLERRQRIENEMYKRLDVLLTKYCA